MRGHDSQSAHICNWGAADRRAETAAQHFRRGECRSRNRYNRLFAQAGGECSPPPGKGLAGPYPPSRNLSAGRTKRGAARGGGQRQAPAMASEWDRRPRSEEHTSELQSLMRISYAVFCLKNKKKVTNVTEAHTNNIQYQR